MILVLSYIVLFVYSIAILLIFFYSLAQFNLLLNYLKSKKNKKVIEKFNFANADEIPFVTVQLPTYNEKYVIELKIWRGERAHQKGLIQLADYLESQQMDEGYLLVFDHHKIKNWACESTIENGKRIFMVWV